MTLLTLVGHGKRDVFDLYKMDLTGVTEVRINAKDGNDRILTTDLVDNISAGSGDDFVWTAGGDDFVSAGAGNDVVHVGNGDDHVLGGTGDDLIYGGHGDDILAGEDGNDTIHGLKGHNTLLGGAGDDTITTGKHASLANGGDGDDRLIAWMAQSGDHTLIGGAGADTFVFEGFASSRISDNIIVDYQIGVDHLEIGNETEVEIFADLAAGTSAHSIMQDDADVVLTLASGDSIRFLGLELADFGLI